MTLLVLSVAGGVGAALRFLVDGFVARRNPFRIPLGTLLINVTGSLGLGILVGWATYGHGGTSADSLTAVLGTGLCGGYTTFSTAAVESMRLWFAEGPGPGGRYAATTLVGGVAAAFVGLAIGALL